VEQCLLGYRPVGKLDDKGMVFLRLPDGLPDIEQLVAERHWCYPIH
jgi:hypothetical protein